ncbi:MAG: HIT family protein [Rhodospirillales bacterium]|nr:MAG: HIT family protein [Rhodospirillales bacterium]
MSHPVDHDCVFCRIVAGTIPCFRLFEDGATLAFMDINPAGEGHALAIAKGHWPTILDIPAETIGAVAATAKRVATAVDAALKPDGVNLIQANGPGAAQSVPHFHIHVLPRRLGDGLAINWNPKPGDMAAIRATHELLLRHI